WHGLYHPNVVQPYGARHIGPPFFACEYAGAALGLRYLHAKRIIHRDLMCNNSLVGSDGQAKLTDFGLSTLGVLVSADENHGEDAEILLKNGEQVKIGAVRWKAPEALLGEKATYSSDVYSFGMCILEAVSGKYPWGMALLDVVVKYQVVTAQRIPQRPGHCSVEAYELVKRMCQFEAHKR
ncbi:hypothetical protein PHYSODRAFT_462389, partial [Phytophthora sojae]